MNILNDLISLHYNYFLGLGFYLLFMVVASFIGFKTLSSPKYEDYLNKGNKSHNLYFLLGFLIGFALLYYNENSYVGIIYIVTLSVAFITDCSKGYILNILTYPSFIVGVLGGILDLLHGEAFLTSGILAAILVLILFVILVAALPGRIGFGDIKLFLVIALFVGPTGLFFVLFISCLTGIVFGIFVMLKTKESAPLVFGPHIVFAVLMVQVFNLTTFDISKFLY